MQVIENWSNVRGKVLDIHPNVALSGFSSARIHVESVAPVAGFANLLGSTLNQTISVNIPESLKQGDFLLPGAIVTLRMKLGGPGSIFAHPDVP